MAARPKSHARVPRVDGSTDAARRRETDEHGRAGARLAIWPERRPASSRRPVTAASPVPRTSGYRSPRRRSPPRAPPFAPASPARLRRRTAVAARASPRGSGGDLPSHRATGEARIAAAVATRSTRVSASRRGPARPGPASRGADRDADRRPSPVRAAHRRPKVTVDRERHAPRAMSEKAKRQRRNALILVNSRESQLSRRSARRRRCGRPSAPIWRRPEVHGAIICGRAARFLRLTSKGRTTKNRMSVADARARRWSAPPRATAAPTRFRAAASNPGTRRSDRSEVRC
jgi:hypothetical protein